MDNQLVSVIVPAYNREKKIHRCLSSVLEQSYSSLEVIVVDDGSSDNTCKVVSALGEQDSRIKLVKLESNKGAQHARNVGIKESAGSWISFLDSDDYLLKDSIEKRLTCALSNNVDVVHSDCFVLGNDGEKKLYGVKPLKGRVYKDLLTAPAPVFPSLLVARQALEQIGLLDEAIISYQEWDTCIRLASQYEFGFVDAPGFVYDCMDTDTISSDLLRDASGYLQIFNKHRSAISKHNGNRSIANHYAFIYSRFKRAGHYFKAIRYKLLSGVYIILAQAV